MPCPEFAGFRTALQGALKSGLQCWQIILVNKAAKMTSRNFIGPVTGNFFDRRTDVSDDAFTIGPEDHEIVIFQQRVVKVFFPGHNHTSTKGPFILYQGLNYSDTPQ